MIPSHNSARYLGCAIESVLAQTLTDLELIVIDDGSSDDTMAVAAAHDDPRIRLVRQEARRGIAATRNHGLALARGDYMASLDADDWAHPQRLARQVAFLDAHRDHAVVGSWAAWMDADGQPRPGITRRPTRADDAAAQLIFKSCLQQPSVTGRTDVLRDIGYDETFDLSSDYDLWVRLAEYHRMTSQPLALVRCRRHPTSTTRGKSARVIARQHAIFAYQFDRLGMDYTAADLDRHRLIWRSGKHAAPMQDDDLDWSEQWLARLAEANRRTRYYPLAAFEAVLGLGWLHMCRSAARQGAVSALARAVRSPLRVSARRAIGREIATRWVDRSARPALTPGRGAHDAPGSSS
ncbi:family 2 glycosyl transferase [Salinisphaera sp. T31B1]